MSVTSSSRGVRRHLPLAHAVLLAGMLLPLAACNLVAPGMQMMLPDAGIVRQGEERGTPLKVDLLPITPDLLAQQAAAREAVSIPDTLLAPAPAYRLGFGDVLNVLVYEHPEFSAVAQGVSGANASTLGFVIDDQGNLRFPLVGNVQAAGRSVNDVAEELSRRLAKYVQTPQATVRVIDYRSQKVLVDGEVHAPGLVAITEVPLTLTDALGRAGGALPAADQSRVILFRGGVRHDINIPALMAAGIPVHKLALLDGDVLRVPGSKESQVYVIGEVPKPAPVAMRYNGLRLSEALGEVLGVSGTTGDARQIYVIRNAGLDRAEVYHLNAKSPVSLALADNFRLQPRDVVYVDSTALVRFNRVISLILPSAQAVRVGEAIGGY